MNDNKVYTSHKKFHTERFVFKSRRLHRHTSIFSRRNDRNSRNFYWLEPTGCTALDTEGASDSGDDRCDDLKQLLPG